jgi:DnaK suppressor protein
MAKRKAKKDELQEKTEKLERLREFVDETAFGGDERELTGELTVADQHPGDVADFVYQRELMQTAREILDEEMTQAHDAMERRAEGRYGICENCGKKIPKARLAARPQATLCISCQREREAGRQRLAS